MLPIYSVKTPSGQPLEKWVHSPHSTHTSEAINCEELHFRIATTIFKSSFQWLPVYTAFFWWVKRGCCRSLVFLTFSTVSLHSLKPLQKKLPSLPFIVSGSMDHGLPCGFWWQHRQRTSIWRQHRPWPSTWPLVTWTMDIHKASGCSTDHGHHHDHQQQHWPQIPTWPPSGAQDIHTDINMASIGSTAHRYQHDFRQ